MAPGMGIPASDAGDVGPSKGGRQEWTAFCKSQGEAMSISQPEKDGSEKIPHDYS
jgi:hypothetical protein